MYSVKEMFYTLQGEGARAGRASVFLRFAGCNLWTGREQDRHKAICKFCDTQFVGTDGENGGKFKVAERLAGEVRKIWCDGAEEYYKGKPYVVCTGGEPLLQLDERLIRALHGEGFEIAVETNGTVKAPQGIDWICVSPKANSNIIQTSGNELKLVYPQPENKPEDYEGLDFEHFFLSPKDEAFQPSFPVSELRKSPLDETVKYCLDHPQWRLSLQTHKQLGLK